MGQSQWSLPDSIGTKIKKALHRFRIYECSNLGEKWYEVTAWHWYWPFWTKVTHPEPGGSTAVTRFRSIYHARQTINFRQWGSNNYSERFIERH